MTDARKRAQAAMREHVIGADVFDLHIDAMLAFAAEERKADKANLIKYGQHVWSCNVARQLGIAPYVCGCGFQEATERTDNE